MGGVVSAVSNAVNNTVSQVSNGVNNVLDQAGRGDVGSYIKDQGQSIGNVAKAPIEVAYDVSRGDIQHAGTTINRTIGSAVDLAPGTYLARTDLGQKILTNPYVDKLTFGYSSDYYGTAHGAGTLKDTGNISGADLNSAVRFGAKSAIIAGGAAYAGSESLTAAKLKQDYLLAQTANSAISRGNYLGAATALGAGDYLPQIDRPDWLPNVDIPHDLIPSLSGSQGGSSAPNTVSPWQWGGTADGGMPGSASVLAPSILAIGAIFVGAYLLRKKGVI